MPEHFFSRVFRVSPDLTKRKNLTHVTESGGKETVQPLTTEEFAAFALRFQFCSQVIPHRLFKRFGREMLQEIRGKIPPEWEKSAQELEDSMRSNSFSPSIKKLYNRMPASVSSFDLLNRRLHRTREIRDFRELLRSKILHSEAFRDALKDVMVQPDNQKGDYIQLHSKDLAETYRNCLDLYREVSSEEVPMYRSLIRILKRLPRIENRPICRFLERKIKKPAGRHVREVYHGRDARAMYLARKAGLFGNAKRRPNELISYIITTKALLEPPQEDNLRAYISDRHIPIDAYHIDTGYLGSAPQRVIKLVAREAGIILSRAEIDRRIKLIGTNASSRRITGWRDPYHYSIGVIENRARSTNSPRKYKKNRLGKIVPDIYYLSHVTQLEQWAYDQAIMRTFVPKYDNA